MRRFDFRRAKFRAIETSSEVKLRLKFNIDFFVGLDAKFRKAELIFAALDKDIRHFGDISSRAKLCSLKLSISLELSAFMKYQCPLSNKKNILTHRFFLCIPCQTKILTPST